MINNAEVPSNMFTVAPGVWGRKDVFVNFFIIQDLINEEWVLIDSGLKWSADKVKEMAAYLFGPVSKPVAIILTHGHFDHVGSVSTLANDWDIPVFAHQLEIPYLTGESDYPPPDPTVGGGLMATMSFLYPNSPIDISRRVQVLPPNGSIPVLREWKYMHTPGHSPGHISLFRESDSVLIAGDAFVTTKQESLISVMFQTRKISGPPKYFTSNWNDARNSVEELIKLNPKTAATGHGQPMRGTELQQALKKLSDNFYTDAIPAQGRYVPNPAITNATGVLYVPPKKYLKNELPIKTFSITALATAGLVWTFYKKKKKTRENQNLIDIEYNY